jgi:hypothetical protein
MIISKEWVFLMLTTLTLTGIELPVNLDLEVEMH